MDATYGDMGLAIASMYVKHYFKPEDKAEVRLRLQNQHKSAGEGAVDDDL